jgi:hypothetical protein
VVRYTSGQKIKAHWEWDVHPDRRLSQVKKNRCRDLRGGIRFWNMLYDLFKLKIS